MSEQVSMLRDALAGRYAIEREIGHGGMATVYLAHDVRHDRDVAIKVLHPQLAMAVGAERFLREIQVAARLRHPHILPLFDSGEAGGLLYYVMPYVGGESLRQRLQRSGRLPPLEALRIASEVADALDQAHREGVIHRDIKPDNVMLDGRHAMVTDFGIARAIATSDSQSTLTSTGLLLGTPGYMSPEQVSGETALDGRSDIYSLGCMLCEMLTGAPPFAGASAQAVMARRFSTPKPELPADIAPAARSIVENAMQLAPDDRYQTAREMGDALDAAIRRVDGTRMAVAGTARDHWGRGWNLRAGVLAALALVVAAIAWRRLDWHRAPPIAPARAAAPSIGVLPFANRSDDRAMEYFSDGVTDELITALSRVKGLQVAGRTSTFSLKEKGLTAQQAAQTLHVNLLVDGSVRNDGSTVRVTWQLIDGASGRGINSGDFDGRIRDAIALQDSLAHTIVAQLRPELGIAVEAAAPRHTTANFDAYNLYLRAHYFWNQRTPATLRQGIALFRQALALDSSYADAWAELASAYALEPGFGDMRPADAIGPARDAAERAVRLDSTSSNAYTALGIISTFNDRDWPRALQYLDRAVALDSANSFPRLFRAWPLVGLGRLDDALQDLRTARQLDPLSPIINTRLGSTLEYARQYDEAITELRKAIALDPSNVLARFELGKTLAVQGHFDQALKEFPDALEAQGGYCAGWLGASYGLARRQDDARAVYRRLEALSRVRYVTPEGLALAALGSGDTSLALDWLERGLRENSFYLVFLNVDPMFDPLRNEPRFKAILARMPAGARRT